MHTLQGHCKPLFGPNPTSFKVTHHRSCFPSTGTKTDLLLPGVGAPALVYGAGSFRNPLGECICDDALVVEQS